MMPSACSINSARPAFAVTFAFRRHRRTLRSPHFRKLVSFGGSRLRLPRPYSGDSEYLLRQSSFAALESSAEVGRVERWLDPGSPKVRRASPALQHPEVSGIPAILLDR